MFVYRRNSSDKIIHTWHGIGEPLFCSYNSSLTAVRVNKAARGHATTTTQFYILPQDALKARLAHSKSLKGQVVEESHWLAVSQPLWRRFFEALPDRKHFSVYPRFLNVRKFYKYIVFSMHQES